MKDDKIIKALECCKTHHHLDNCVCCPLDRKKNCKETLAKNALDLIKRQRAEIKKQQKEIEDMQMYVEDIRAEYDTNDVARKEAIEKFVINLKCGVPQETGIIRCADVDNLATEMLAALGFAPET